MATADQIVQVAEYEVTGDPDAYLEAIAAVAARVEAEGVSTMTRYTFYLDRDAGTVTSVIVHESAESWVNHHRMLEQWAAEYGRLKETFHQTRLRIFGPVTDDIRAWLGEHGAAFEEAGLLSGGFERP